METYDTDQPWVIYRYLSTDRETRITGRSRIQCECAVCGTRKTLRLKIPRFGKITEPKGGKHVERLRFLREHLHADSARNPYVVGEAAPESGGAPWRDRPRPARDASRSRPARSRSYRVSTDAKGHLMDAAASLSRHKFWLDGGYDFDSVKGCRHHPNHRWITVRLGDVIREGGCGNPDELMTFCVACYVPRCGTTTDADRCTLWRHHETDHVYESRKKEPVGGW